MASLPSSFQTYAAKRHEPSARRSMKRVSTGRPACENCFHSFVPRGNTQASAFDASMKRPGGSDSQRCFSAPSDHSGYCGVKRSSLASPGSQPVSRRCCGKAGAAAAGPSAASRTMVVARRFTMK
jgi:hypothetical protein